MINIIHNDPGADILVVTPLLSNQEQKHSISKETLQSIKTNSVPYIWIASEGPFKHARNVQEGLNDYKAIYGSLPTYIQILDRDIILGRKFLDRIYRHFDKQPEMFGFAYCGFRYTGHINIEFRPKLYSIEQLKDCNYISSNSLYRSSAVEKVGGFVTDEKYHRLSDWAMFLKLYKHGFIGSLCYDTTFTAMSTKDDISAGSREEYLKAQKQIFDDFVKPIL